MTEFNIGADVYGSARSCWYVFPFRPSDKLNKARMLVRVVAVSGGCHFGGDWSARKSLGILGREMSTQ